jgi:hypothetical protein
MPFHLPCRMKYREIRLDPHSVIHSFIPPFPPQNEFISKKIKNIYGIFKLYASGT